MIVQIKIKLYLKNTNNLFKKVFFIVITVTIMNNTICLTLKKYPHEFMMIKMCKSNVI
jgi:hypothetical protein